MAADPVSRMQMAKIRDGFLGFLKGFGLGFDMGVTLWFFRGPGSEVRKKWGLSDDNDGRQTYATWGRWFESYRNKANDGDRVD
jgi:hypothetical protein